MNDSLENIFDNMAGNYDGLVKHTGFPFEGYQQVLDTIVEQSGHNNSMNILDLGTGTGNLAKRFADMGCRVWGTDFSAEMLIEAGSKVPGGVFIKSDLRNLLPQVADTLFDRIVSAYVFHHFHLQVKVELLSAFATQLMPSGYFVIGDLSFETLEDKMKTRMKYAKDWDDEAYWIAADAVPALEHAGFKVDYRQISFCAGVYTIRKGEPIQ